MDLQMEGPIFTDIIDTKQEMDNVLGEMQGYAINYDDLNTYGGDLNTLSFSTEPFNNIFDFRGSDCNFVASKMVKPSSIMNITRVRTPTLTSTCQVEETPSPKRSHLTFSPVNGVAIKDVRDSIENVKKDLLNSLKTEIEIKEEPIIPFIDNIKQENNFDEKNISQYFNNKIVTLQQSSSLNNHHQPQFNYIELKKQAKSYIITKGGDGGQTTKTVQFLTVQNNSFNNNNNKHHNNITTMNNNNNTSRKTNANNHHNIHRKINKIQQNTDDSIRNNQHFPKPNYSYSCLIAMALKNSRTGSLPVSEIYNFMCEHFPYFKTAPNGWKNSVRHNLSLNKCFAKIEKPAVNGSQRKGCLWAMHPDKISKMDEEVQKWSRKDPTAIRRAMIYPEQLEALEKGELKYGSENYEDSESELEDTETEDLDNDNNITLTEDQEYVDINSSIGDSFDEGSLTDDGELNDYLSSFENQSISSSVNNEKEPMRLEISYAHDSLHKQKCGDVALDFDNENNGGGGSYEKRIRLMERLAPFIQDTDGGGSQYKQNAGNKHEDRTLKRKPQLLVRNYSNSHFIEVEYQE